MGYRARTYRSMTASTTAESVPRRASSSALLETEETRAAGEPERREEYCSRLLRDTTVEMGGINNICYRGWPIKEESEANAQKLARFGFVGHVWG